MMKYWMTASAVGAVMMLGSVAAYAAPVEPTYVPCATGGATLSGAVYEECIGPINGNDTGAGSTLLADLNSGSAFAGFGSADLGSMWTLVGKSDVGGDPITGDGGNVTSGAWAALSGLLSNVVVSVKAGECYSAYLFSGVNGPSGSGTFNTALAGLRVGGGQTTIACAGVNAPGISHISVFTAGEMTPIPLPAAGWLLLAGVGGLVAMRRKKAA